jgi:hypothetical protein
MRYVNLFMRHNKPLRGRGVRSMNSGFDSALIKGSTSHNGVMTQVHFGVRLHITWLASVYSVSVNTTQQNSVYCTSPYLVFYWVPVSAKRTYRWEVCVVSV